MDASQGPDPYAPDHAAAQKASAEDLAPPNQTPGQGPGSPNLEQFPAETEPVESFTADPEPIITPPVKPVKSAKSTTSEESSDGLSKA